MDLNHPWIQLKEIPQHLLPISLVHLSSIFPTSVLQLIQTIPVQQMCHFYLSSVPCTHLGELAMC